MNKSDVIRELKEKFPHIPPRDVELMVDIILDTLASAIKKGERVEIRDFGNLTARKRKARLVRNPKKADDKIPVAERIAVHFKAGKEIKEKIQNLK